MKAAQTVTVLAMTVLAALFLWFFATKPAELKSSTAPKTAQINSEPASGSAYMNTTQTPAPDLKAKSYDAAPEMTIDVNKSYDAILKTDRGNLKIKLYPDVAPVTVNNFVFLAREHFYDNTVFHRIISDFMIQGGDPTGTGAGGPGYRFNDEPVKGTYTRGTLAMANAGKNTNGSQFFIMHQDRGLQADYVIFGAIDPSDTESLKTLDAIATAPVVRSASGELSTPQTPVNLLSVTIVEG